MVYRKKTKISKPPTRRSPTQSCFQRNFDPVCNPNEYGLNYGKVELNLGGRKCTFVDGEWIVDNNFPRSSTPIRKADGASEEIKKLVDENNFLKLKVEILLTLLSELKVKTSNEQKMVKGDH
ncbi:hypothetical protein NPIL_74081 [Nephila pilipes]|uniref:Chibby n=1 Tax=Nephila pilipes TaxID=299642 RepID=A0A8X6P7V7_NEPPI|nr:hypothetical protein NPIL_74081 [Nephila pilipes]